MGWHRTILLIGVLLFASVLWQITVLDRLIVALVVLLVLCWVWNRKTLSGLGIERTVQADRLSVGESLVEEITVSNRSRLPKLWVELEDRSTFPAHDLGTILSIRGRGRSSWRIETPAESRGRFRLGPIWASAGDPVGLFNSNHLMPVTHNILVLPARIDVSSIPLPTGQLTGGRASHPAAMMTTPSAGSIREYVSGDPMHRISWSATARRGHLMVKEFEPNPNADLWILLDLNDDGQFELQSRNDLPPHQRHLHSTVEYIISIGYSLVEQGLAEGRRVGLILNRNPPMRFEPDSSERQFIRIAEALAVVTSSGSRSITESLVADARKFSSKTGLVVVSADPGSDWVAVGSSLVQRRVPVTAVVIDAGGRGADDVGPLTDRLARAGVHVHRYPTFTHRVNAGAQ